MKLLNIYFMDIKRKQFTVHHLMLNFRYFIWRPTYINIANIAYSVHRITNMLF